MAALEYGQTDEVGVGYVDSEMPSSLAHIRTEPLAPYMVRMTNAASLKAELKNTMSSKNRKHMLEVSIDRKGLA